MSYMLKKMWSADPRAPRLLPCKICVYTHEHVMYIQHINVHIAYCLTHIRIVWFIIAIPTSHDIAVNNHNFHVQKTVQWPLKDIWTQLAIPYIYIIHKGLFPSSRRILTLLNQFKTHFTQAFFSNKCWTCLSYFYQVLQAYYGPKVRIYGVCNAF